MECTALCERGEITEEKLTSYKQNACTSCGACSFMGTASTMQIMAEAPSDAPRKRSDASNESGSSYCGKEKPENRLYGLQSMI